MLTKTLIKQNCFGIQTIGNIRAIQTSVEDVWCDTETIKVIQNAKIPTSSKERFKFLQIHEISLSRIFPSMIATCGEIFPTQNGFYLLQAASYNCYQFEFGELVEEIGKQITAKFVKFQKFLLTHFLLLNEISCFNKQRSKINMIWTSCDTQPLSCSSNMSINLYLFIGIFWSKYIMKTYCNGIMAFSMPN